MGAKATLATHCVHGHELTPANAAMQTDSKGHTYRRCLACRPRYDAKYRASAAAKAAQRRYLAKMQAEGPIYAGYTPKSIARSTLPILDDLLSAVRDTGRIQAAYALSSPARVRALKVFFPKARKEIDRALAANRHKAANIIRAPAILMRPLNAAGLMKRISNAMPRALPRDMRDDIVSEMTLAVLDGRLKPDDIERRVREFVSGNFRDEHNKFGPLSLDMPAFRDGETPLIETIQHGLWQ